MEKWKKRFIRFSRKLFGIEPLNIRKGFSEETKQQVRRIQKYRCAHCNEEKQYYNFDHMRGRNDNSIQNCQMLCLDCNTRKTDQDREKAQIDKRRKKSNTTKKHKKLKLL